VWEQDLTQTQRRTTAASHHVGGDPLNGVEVLLASGAVGVLGDLFRLTEEDCFRDAALRIVRPLVPELADPYGDPGAAAVGFYRQTFNDTSLDEAICAQIDAFPEAPVGEWVMMFPEAYRRRLTDVGKRADMTMWAMRNVDGSIRDMVEPSTAALTLGYQVTGDAAFAARALDQAARKLKMARRVLRGGREHADMGGAVCSVAAGHGRNWGAGAVTGCYGQLVVGDRLFCGMHDPLLDVAGEDGRRGLPGGLLSLVRPSPDGGRVTFTNATASPVSFTWKAHDTMHCEALSPGVTEERLLASAEVDA